VIYNITIAQKRFEKLVAKALAGKEVILARRKDPVAQLVPVTQRESPPKKRTHKAK
jgi:antitoxin (DNA-binding transcriptional repressor) of toxin-antitoxin stability system